jgi:hypothetical protein
MVEVGHKWGFVYITGKEVIIHFAENFREGHAVVKLNDMYGFIYKRKIKFS